MLPSLAGLTIEQTGVKRPPGYRVLEQLKEEKEKREMEERRLIEKKARLLAEEKTKLAAEKAAKKEAMRVSQSNGIYEKFLPGILAPIGVDQVFETLVQQFAIAETEVEGRAEFNGDMPDSTVVGEDEDYIERALDNLEDELFKYGKSRYAVSFETVIRSELARIKEEVKLYRETAQRVDRPADFKKLSSEDREAIQDRFNAIKSLVEPTPLRYTGSLPALAPPLSMRVLPHAQHIDLHSQEGNTVGINDQAVRSWLRSVLNGLYKKITYSTDENMLRIVERKSASSYTLLRLYKKCLAVAVASKRTDALLVSRRIVVGDPDNPITIVANVSLVGWHIPLPLSDAPPWFVDVISYIRRLSEDSLDTNIALIRRDALCDAIMDEVPTRQLGAIRVVLDTSDSNTDVPVGMDDGQESEEDIEDEEDNNDPDDNHTNTTTVPKLCIEFGEGWQTCSASTLLMDPIKVTKYATGINSMKLFTQTISLYRKRENTKALEAFRDSTDVSAVVLWGRHARVLFKNTDGGVAIVDPWMPSNRVRIPSIIRKIFNLNHVQWVARSSEQCMEGSCTYVATARALVIATAAAAGLSTMEAAKTDIRTGHGPYMVALVKMLIYARNAERLPTSPEMP